MTRLLLCLVILASSWPSTARACDTVATAKLDSTCVVLPREGIRGLWYDLATANKLRKASLLVPELESQLKLQVEKVTVRDFQLNGYREAYDLQLEIQAQQQDAIALLTKQEREAREALHVWYRSPTLWFTVGVVVSGGVFGAAVVLTSR